MCGEGMSRSTPLGLLAVCRHAERPSYISVEGISFFGRNFPCCLLRPFHRRESPPRFPEANNPIYGIMSEILAWSARNGYYAIRCGAKSVHRLSKLGSSNEAKGDPSCFSPI